MESSSFVHSTSLDKRNTRDASEKAHTLIMDMSNEGELYFDSDFSEYLPGKDKSKNYAHASDLPLEEYRLQIQYWLVFIWEQ